jgi:acyl transferase domain-containing protein
VESYRRPVGLFLEAPPDPRAELLLLSANTASSLKDQIELYEGYVRHKSENLMSFDLAYTLALRRDKLPHRAFSVLQNGQFTTTSSLVKAPAEAPQLYLIFSGQGAQWPGMGKELIQCDPLFRKTIERMDEVLRNVAEPPSWTLIGMHNCRSREQTR